MPLISGWGRYPVVESTQITFESDARLEDILTQSSPSTAMIPRGLGRSYGDSSLGERVISTVRMNRFISFEDAKGVLVCEAGVSIAEVIDTFLPQGWFVPVTPGTKYVTVGGAIASDVHGKNHHRSGSFSNHVEWLELAMADGSVVRCSRSERPELFDATCAGYGLTGVILRAAIRLIPAETPYIRQHSIKARNLEEAMAVFEENSTWTYSVAWIDTLSGGRNAGRSVIVLGEHAKRTEMPNYASIRREDGARDASVTRYKLKLKRQLSVPFDFPSFFLNPVTVGAFNYFYYHKSPARGKDEVVDYDTFFYPLDSILNWNRIYGKRGFAQYQLVLPRDGSKEGLHEILRNTSEHGDASFLAVLKLFGKEDPPYLSFAKEGYTLALDFPITRNLFEQLKELDAIVQHYGGRLYLTKDYRMGAEMLRAGYPDLDKFLQVRERADPQKRFASLQSKRLGI